MPKTKQTYEQMIKRLEEIEQLLSAGDIALEEMIKLYEEGAGLIEKCRALLEGYQAKLEIIESQRSGEKDE